MSKEHKILTEFFTFLVNNQDHSQLQQQNAEGIIQDYYNFKNEQAEELKEEKRLEGLKKLALIVQKREEREKQTKIKGLIRAQAKAKAQEQAQEQAQAKVKAQEQQVVPNKKPNIMRLKVKKIREMQALIDRIRN